MSGRLLFLVMLLTCCDTDIFGQSLSDLPPCGQSCIIAAAVVCPPSSNGKSENICLCANKDFGTGIRDCIAQQCVAGTDLNSIYTYVETFCAPTGEIQAVSALTNGSVTTLPSLIAVTTEAILATGYGQSLIPTTIGSTTIYSVVKVYTTYISTWTAVVPLSGSLATTTYGYTLVVTDLSQYTSLQSSLAAASTSSGVTPTGSPGSSNGTGLSTGAKAGIGVAVGVGGAVVLGVAIFLLMRRRKKGVRRHDSRYGKAELHSKDLPRTHGKGELDGRPLAELDAQETEKKETKELAGSDVPELKSSSGGTTTNTLTEKGSDVMASGGMR